jgi:two-component system, OmpR family, phosphate regulon sensor histidine kinase PhoR
MKKLRWPALLMMVTILGITGFQLYWLKQNYSREEKTLAIKSEAAFRETIEQLQVVKLKLDGIPLDTGNRRKIQIFMNEGGDREVRAHFPPRQEIISTINIIRQKLKDSLKANPGGKARLVFSMDTTSFSYRNDTAKFDKRIPNGLRDHFFNVLYGVDSLQDSLKLKEISTAYSGELKQQNLDIPFTVVRLDSSSSSDEPVFNEVTVGFVNPVTYRLKLGNTFRYLTGQISLPILFSVLLLGITVFSFLLLYKNLLRQRRLAEIKNEFISNITHELKTPIATVSVAIEALRNFGASQSAEKTKEYLDISASELQRLGLLVDKVLKLSMFENKDVELKKETFDMKELINEVMQIMKLQFEKHHAQVNVKIEGDHFMIEADRLHMTSVLYNLLDNALKYSNENPVIEVQLSALPKDIIEIKVSDNGRGIPKEYQSRVFDKFFRVPVGNRHDVKGYGLGLSYVKEIIRSHMGYIEVESTAGKGSVFTIKLPLKEMPVIDFGNNRKIIIKQIKIGK